MGVRGLATYFSNRELFFDEVRLRDGKVVIDGNNLRFALYKWCPGLNHCFGGDYDKYARYVRLFFQQAFLDNGISPIVVFDGGLDKTDQKLATVVHRMQEAARTAVSCNSVTQSKLQVFPLFGRAVFQEVLAELGVRMVQCSYEADHVIAKLAITEDCPVISNDSDFFIFDVSFVSLDSLELEAGGEGLLCRRFNRPRALQHYGLLTVEMLHLLAALMGNDYIPPKVFEGIFQKIKLPKKSRDGSERHRRIKGLMLYLAREREAEAALNQLLGLFQETERARLRERVQHSLAVYGAREDCGLVSRDFSSAAGRQLPAWLEEEHHAALLPPWLAGIATSNKFFLPAQVEVRGLPSAHLAALPLHRALAALLSSPDPVTLHTRAGAAIRPLSLLQAEAPDLGGLELATLREAPVAQRRHLLRRLLCPGLEEAAAGGPPPRLQLLAMVLRCWTLSARVSPGSLQAVLLCHTVLTGLDPATGVMERSTKRLQEAARGEGDLEAKARLQAAADLSPAFHIQEGMKTSTKNFDPLLVHSFSILQAIAFAAMALNQLLGGVYSFPRISDLFNGTFLYNMSLQLDRSGGRAVVLPAGLEAELQVAMEAVRGLGTDTELQIKPRKEAKSKKKLKTPIEEGGECGGAVMDNFHDLGNRFAALCVE